MTNVESAQLAVAIIGLGLLYTSSVVGLVLWLAGRFRSLEATIFKEVNRLKHDYDMRLSEHNMRLLLLELEVKGEGYAGFFREKANPTPGEKEDD